MCTCMCACVYVHVCAHVCVCVCVCVYIYMCMNRVVLFPDYPRCEILETSVGGGESLVI